MRLKLEFKSMSEQLMTYDYLHGISSWIYEQLRIINPALSQHLHQSNKPKCFSFSYFTFERCNSNSKGVILPKGLKVTLHINITDMQLQPVFLKALNVDTNRYHRIANLDLLLDNVTVLRRPRLHSKYVFKGVTPIHVTKRKGNKEVYLHPTKDESYGFYLFKNLNNKVNKAFDEEDLSNFSLNILSEPKEVLHQIKDLKIKAYLYDFTINCPPSLALAGYDNGFGRLNSQGYGFVR
jgi:CRISPR-associated endoribonuclease Cas6